jgi:hypothetical protein
MKHPNELVLRPISNHPLAMLHTFKIRSHPSSSILIPSPPHYQLKTSPISYHPLATHIHFRNRSHPNHIVMRPMILHTFKIRSHPSSSILPHQQLKTRPISHHPLATHSHSRNRNRSHPNHLVMRPISNHPLMILNTCKIRIHPSSSNNGSRTHSTTMKSPCECRMFNLK